MPTLRVLNGNGDRRITWSVAAMEDGDAEAQQAVREAERIFTQELRRGAAAFRVVPGSPAERVDALDTRADETILLPPMIGG